MRRVLHATLAIALGIVLAACSKDKEQVPLDTSPIVTVIYPSTGLGDRSYVDKIYLGAERAALEGGVRVMHLVPDDLQEAQELVMEALEHDHDDDIRRLYIITENGIEDQIEEFSKLVPDDKKRQFLFVETRLQLPGINSLYLPLYGVCYEAGVIASTMRDVHKAVAVVANPNLEMLGEASKAFKEGFGAGNVDTIYLSEEHEGFDMAGGLYQRAYDLDKEYQIAIPLCGGSAQGLFRYNREFPADSFYTIGVDADMSEYSPRVPFSCVKHIDKAVLTSIRRWLKGTLPEHQILGLGSGYTELVISQAYEEQFRPELNRIHSAAIKKENEYEKNL